METKVTPDILIELGWIKHEFRDHYMYLDENVIGGIIFDDELDNISLFKVVDLMIRKRIRMMINKIDYLFKKGEI